MNNLEQVWTNEKLAETLERGGVVVMPTDTIYGIVGQALNRETVEKIYSLKHRAPEKPCIILINDVSVLEKFSISLSAKQISILNQYWPGPVSIIVECQNNDFSYLHRGTNTLAFRMPKSENLKLLVSLTGPLIAPSANIEGQIPAEDIKQAKNYFGNDVDLYIDGGYISGKASKLLRLNREGEVEILRP